MSYSEAVVLSLTFVTGVQLYAKFRQLRKFQEKQKPAALQSLVSDEDFHKSQAYQFDKLSFEILTSYLSFVQTVAVIVFQLLPWGWGKAEQLAGYFGFTNETVVCLCFVGLWWLSSKVEGLAFDLYSIFVIEERHGYNRQTLLLFITDFFKSLFEMVLVQVPLISVLLWILNNGGEQFYLYVWVFLSMFIIVMMYVYPILIAPMFNKYTEMEQEPLRTKIHDLASKLHFPLTKIFLVDGSKRSDHSNAYLYGFWNNKRIVLFDTLLSKEKDMKDEDVLGILAHELGHWKRYHVLQHLLVVETHLFVIFYLFGMILNSPTFYASFGFPETSSKFIGLLLFTMVLTPADFVLELLVVKFTRYHEFQADQFAKQVNFGHFLKSALTKIYVQNSGNLNPDSLYASIYFSHPHLTERLEALGKIE